MTYVTAYAAFGDIVEQECPNGCGPSVIVAWVAMSDHGTTPMGCVLGCDVCRPGGVWSCRFCPTLMDIDAARVLAHLIECVPRA